MRVYDVFTDLDPQQLTQVAVETYYKWLQFAVGDAEIGGKKLKHPTGRYAASLSWKKTGVAKVAIIADESVAEEVGILESPDGRGAYSMKDKMLVMGLPGVHMSHDGFLYRRIPLRPDQWAPKPSITADILISDSNGERLRGSIGRMWARARPHVDANSRIRTMSSRLGSPRWVIPTMPVYAPGAILAAELKQKYGRP